MIFNNKIFLNNEGEKMKRLFSWISWFIITGGTTSYWFGGIAPGTAGSISAAVLLYVFYLLGWWGATAWSFVFYFFGLGILAILALICMPTGEKFIVEKWEEGKKYGKVEKVVHDHGVTVIDEYLGMLLTSFSTHIALVLGWIPDVSEVVIISLMINLFTFRVFDIYKFFGIEKLERYLTKAAEDEETGIVFTISIMADDALGGIYAFLLSLALIPLLVPMFFKF